MLSDKTTDLSEDTLVLYLGLYSKLGVYNLELEKFSSDELERLSKVLQFKKMSRLPLKSFFINNAAELNSNILVDLLLKKTESAEAAEAEYHRQAMFPNLTILEMPCINCDYCDVDSFDKLFSAYGKNILRLNLRSAVLSDGHINAISSNCSNLSSLDLSCNVVFPRTGDVSSLNIETVKGLLDKNPNIKNLSLADNSEMTSDKLATILGERPRTALTHLNLARCLSISYQDRNKSQLYKFLRDKCPNLIELDLSCCYNIDDTLINDIVKACPNLTNFVKPNRESLTSEHLNKIRTPSLPSSGGSAPSANG